MWLHELGLNEYMRLHEIIWEGLVALQSWNRNPGYEHLFKLNKKNLRSIPNKNLSHRRTCNTFSVISGRLSGCNLLTRAVNEGPLEALVFWAAAWLQAHVALLALLRQPFHGPPVGTLYAQPLSCAARISTPAALWLLQALRTRPQSWTVLC